MEAVEISSAELKIRVYDYALRASERVEAAADEIRSNSSDPQVQRNALMWKSYATAAAYKAAFKRDPLVGLLDVWVLFAQMAHYFTEGAGRDSFGDQQSIAARTCRDLEDLGLAVAQVAAPLNDVSRAQAFVADWVSQHPLESLFFERESPVVQWAVVAGEDQARGLATVASMEVSLNDLMHRLTLYADALPKQARWQAQLLLDDYLEASSVDRFFGDVTSIEESIVIIAVVIDSLGLILDRVQSGVYGLDKQVDTVFEEVDRQRVATLEVLDHERDMITKDLQAELKTALFELERIAGSTVDDTSVRLEAVIDHLFLRITQLLAGVIGAIVLFLFWRRQSRASR